MHVVLESCEPPPAVASQRPRTNALDPGPTPVAAGRNPIRVPVAGNPIVLPDPPGQARPSRESQPAAAGSEIGGLPPPAGIVSNLASVSDATAKAHAAFLDLSGAMTRRYAEALALQTRLLDLAAQREPLAPHDVALVAAPAFTRAQCLEFARGSAAAVLGPEFAEADAFAARVRLPDEPLMLVDRILEVRGTPGALGPGRVVTEHDVRPGAWYLDGGRAPVCITVEAGQADLFLCAYLGIDRVVRGRRTYRLLDATVEFHRELPRPGETIRYEIEIEKFLRQGETYLFLFHFNGTIGGAPLITMTNGCAGFFTQEEVDHSGGIILTDEDRRPRPGKKPVDWTDPVPLAPGAYDDRALSALRAGDLAGCFGKTFDGVDLPEPLRLAGGRMKLIDRVLQFDPVGGRYGLGRIRAEADIRPDDWFLTCHFVDDMVMPGTLMYECCAHALRVFVQRLGWVTDTPGARYEPVQGLRAALKCRGPVTPQTRHVVYEVDIKELGYGPHPFAVADANMIADDRHIVRFSDMSLQLTGATRTDIENFWRKQRRFSTAAQTPTRRPLSYPREHLLEFARGKPSRAFGEPYRPFDADRFIARLPSPPYLFIDRLTAVAPEPWVVKPDGWVEAEYDVPPDAWYIRADRCRSVPYCVLLEAALQPCGWLAAYMGSALKSARPLYFRNLGGHGILHREVAPDAGTLRMRTRLSHVSEVTDMLIEHFDFEISSRDGLVYDGSTYFGFFTQSALERQEGIRDAAQKVFTPAPDQTAHGKAVALADEAPFTPADPAYDASPALTLPARALRMIDRIDLFIADGGPEGLGFVRGSKGIDSQEWFFKAHFYQDPVCPGSLGIESFLQLLKFAARERWPQLGESHRFALATGKPHRWTYRGQILPQNRTVTVEATVSQVAESPHPALLASGWLMVDGLSIYRMEDFGIALVPA
jgi:3-hydroxymyristoyl/3-hydroxydecanoyl-(acyl carrier protein) dehydratase